MDKEPLFKLVLGRVDQLVVIDSFMLKCPTFTGKACSLLDAADMECCNFKKDENVNAKQKDEEDCAICLCSMEEGKVLTLEACSHKFHEDCIKDWLAEKRDCPMCRKFTLLNEEYPRLT